MHKNMTKKIETDIFAHFLRLVFIFRIFSMFNLQNSIEVVGEAVRAVRVFLADALRKTDARFKLVVVDAVVWAVAEEEVLFVTL